MRRRTLGALALLLWATACAGGRAQQLVTSEAEAQGERPEVELVYEHPLEEALQAAARVLAGKYGYLVGRASPTELLTARQTSVSGIEGGEAWSRYYVQGVDLGGTRSMVRVFRARLAQAGNPTMESRRTQREERLMLRTFTGRSQLEAFQERAEARASAQAGGPERTSLEVDPMRDLRKQEAAVQHAQDTFGGQFAGELEPFYIDRARRELHVEREVTELLEAVPSLEMVAAPLPVPVPALLADTRLQAARPEVPRCTEALPGAEAVVGAGSTLLLSDPLGTREVPMALAQLACAAAARDLPVVLGLAIPSEEQPYLDAYLASAGAGADLAQLLTAGTFWRRAYQDGRSSRAVLGLLEHARALRAGGQRLDVVALDAETLRGNAREAHMAERVKAARAAHPGAALLLVAGDVHARTQKGVAWDAGLVPLGARLVDAGLTPKVLRAAFQRGTQHACRFDLSGRVVCRLYGRSPTTAALHPYGAPRGVQLHAQLDDEGFHGRVLLGALTASLPVLDVEAAQRRADAAPGPGDVSRRR